jgi:hypothetical protein
MKVLRAHSILQLTAIAIVCLLVCTTEALQTTQNRMAKTPDSSHAILDRRKWMRNAILSTTFGIINTRTATLPANADDDDDENDYENPNMPEAPEERSGLVVLRVAEVCNFQEKILRAVAAKAIDTSISPQQIVFGTKLLLKNSNIAGNMQLMIDTEIPKTKRNVARQNAARTMNTIQSISTTSAKIQRPFTDEEMVLVADLYRDARLQLNAMYEYLPQDGKDKYYGYFMKVTEYEKKIAEGVYNPELDGILKLDY